MRKNLHKIVLSMFKRQYESTMNVLKNEGVKDGMYLYLCINLIITGFTTICITVLSIFFWLITGDFGTIFQNWYMSLCDLLYSYYIEYHLNINGGTVIHIYKLHLAIILFIIVYKNIKAIFRA